MDFDWIDSACDLKAVTPREIEESFEDPFGIRLLPELNDENAGEARYFCLGKTIGNRGLFSLFWTDGKKYRVIFCRDMSAVDSAFYDRKNAEML